MIDDSNFIDASLMRNNAGMAMAVPQSQKGCYYCKFQPYIGMWESTTDPGMHWERRSLGYYTTKEQALSVRKSWELNQSN